MPKRVSINGKRGRWVAEAAGRWRAVLRHTLWVGADRSEAPIMPEHVGDRRPGELEQALRENDPAVIQRDKDAVSLARNGYVGVFRFKDLIIDYKHGLKLTLTEHCADPK